MYDQLYNLLLKNGEMTVDDLVERLPCSSSHVRRELKVGMAQGLITCRKQLLPGKGASKHLYRASAVAKSYLSGSSGERVQEYLNSINSTEVPDINLYATTLTEYFLAISKRTAIVNNLGPDLASIFAFILYNKVIPLPEYNSTLLATQLKNIENYLLGLASLCNQLRNDANYLSIKGNAEQVDVRTPRTFELLNKACKRYLESLKHET